ncbi:4'-phosphopantetheinyl transferase family protein [Herbaspirillum aquaticum]|uniref:4'-phosphopantetheinyl transferase family protein n=1 Tax=Herbaspirillum aquaticum TaxID=568783 RepID=UPI0024DE68B1|nr:4'-phosphopantetheinyl transferase superfamily protein [Herbaspirillum aquaticum]
MEVLLSDAGTQMRSFIPTITPLSLETGSQLRVLTCTFDREAYHDGLYAALGMAQPAQIMGAVVKRKAEYLAGRYLCRLLLQVEGQEGQVAIGPQRQPVWPVGWQGSITHSGNRVVVALWPDRTGRLLGLDLEHWMPTATASTVQSRIILPDELDGLAAHWPSERLLTLAFSAKESLYKALFARVGHFFDFHCAQLCAVDDLSHRFTLRLNQDLGEDLLQGKQFTGGFFAGARQLLTWIACT